MKCPSCGAEIENGRKCAYCGAAIDSGMLREQEILNKAGCPKCGSTNVTFNRENQGEVRGKNSKKVIHYTVGVCKDCGYTWRTDSSKTGTGNKKWLWILGWICIFPLPLTLILLKKKDLKPALKYGIIAAAWILYLILGIVGGSGSGTAGATNTTTPTETADATVATTGVKYTLVGEDLGQYGKKVTLNADSDMPTDKYIYKLPASDYLVSTTTDKVAQFSIVKDEVVTEDADSDYPENFQYVGDAYLLTAGDDDYNGKAKKSVTVTLGEDESFLLVGTDTFIFEEVKK